MAREHHRRADCKDSDVEYACFSVCDIEFQNCYKLCDAGDVYCSRTCVDTYSACEDNCPCNAACPDGCPCPFESTYCNKCETAECLEFAKIVNNKMDTTADPCDDFNQYACGGWENTNTIPSDSGSYTQFSVVRKALSATLNRTLSDPSTEDYQGWESVQKAKNFFKICMDENTINDKSTQLLGDTVKIGWPTQNRPNQDSDQSVQNGITTATAFYGISAIFSADQDLDPQDSNKWIISVGHPSIGMSQSYFTTEVDADRQKYKAAYIDYISKFSMKYAADLGTGASEADINAMAAKIYEFESNIAKYMWTRTENRDPANTQRKRKVGELKTNKIIGNWVAYLNEIFAKVKVTGIDVDEDVIVNLADEKWFGNADKAIEEANMSDDDLLDYIAWRVHMSVVGYLGEDWRAIADEFDQIVSGTEPKPRWQTCSDAANSAMEWPVGKLYVESDFKGESKKVTEEMVEDLMEAFRTDILRDADWMSETTKIQAKDKLEKIQVNIGYPDWLDNEAELNKRYETFDVIDDNYVGTRISGRAWQQSEWWELLQGPVDKSMWLTGPAIVNAFYSSNFNSITFPAGILQPPFFSKDMTTAMNFGGIGVVIGHEITHGFDDQGSKFNGDGNFVNWWTEEDRKNFDDRVQCIKDEYSSFYFEEADKNLNGPLTAGENTADNGGVWESMYGFDISSERAPDKFIPGLSDKYSQKQLFYLSFGQIWCAKYKPEYAKWMVDNDPHSPGRFRTNGSVRNAAGFATAFGCRKGTEMAPEETCRVW